MYQLTTENKYFHLSYYIGRASFAKDREKRNLLIPNQKTQVSFNNSKLISKKLQKGSRIVIVINVNKNNNAQINYGTGKDVNIESIKALLTTFGERLFQSLGQGYCHRWHVCRFFKCKNRTCHPSFPIVFVIF